MRAGTILVIGYGNDLRGDDAAGRKLNHFVGHHVADAGREGGT